MLNVSLYMPFELPPPYVTDTGKFTVAWLIFWILLTVILCALALLNKFKYPAPAMAGHPNVIPYLFAFLQLVVWVLILAAVAHDVWSTDDPENVAWGTIGVRGPPIDESGDVHRYDCSSGMTDDQLMLCQTLIASAAWTLIFGIFAVFVSLALTIHAIMACFSKSTPLSAPVLGNLQWILILASVIIWSVCADVGIDADYVGHGLADVELGSSWVLALVSLILAFIVNLHFSGHPHKGKEGGGSTTTSHHEPAKSESAV